MPTLRETMGLGHINSTFVDFLFFTTGNQHFLRTMTVAAHDISAVFVDSRF